ncbi:MAG: phosphopantothenoylcysteine decarboxylase [Hymenobacter sp.]
MRVLLTAGPTYEPLDPVRFLGNRSTGKMGYALAEAFAAAGRGRDARERARWPYPPASPLITHDARRDGPADVRGRRSDRTAG